MTFEELDLSTLYALLSASHDAFFVLRPIGAPIVDFEVVFANELGASMFGAAPGDLLGKRLNDISPPYEGSFRKDLVACHERREIVERQTTVIAPEISVTKASYRMIPFDGCIAVAAIDLSSERRAETESELLRRVLEAQVVSSPTPSALVRPVYNDDHRVVDIEFTLVNAPAAALLNASPIDVLGRKLFEILPRRSDHIIDIIEDCVRQQQFTSVDYQRTVTDGEWLRIQLTPVGEFVVMHADDISLQRREESMLRAIVEEAAEIIVLSDRHGKMRYANPFTMNTLGYAADELIGRPMVEFTAPHDQNQLIETFVHLRAGAWPVHRHRIQILDSVGQIRTMIASSSALFSPTGEFDGVLTVASDITDRLASEDARSELAAALSVAEQQERERLAGDLHDGPVQRLSALSMQLGAAEGRPADDLAVLLGESEQAVIDTIGELRSLMFHLSSPDLEGIGLTRAIQNRAEMLFEGTSTQIEVETDLRTTPSSTTSAALFRLAQEALVNARKHAEASHLIVRIVQTTADIADGLGDANVILEVNDNGKGATSAEYLHERPGHLGVSTMFDRARQLGGTCEIIGSPGRGTTVRVVLPLHV